MSITYPLSTPTNKTIAEITLVARNVVGVSTSPFTFKQQVYQFSGQRWEADVTLPAMAREDAEQWVSFLMKLYGQKGTFLLGDPLASTTGYLKAGDYIQLGSAATAQFYKVLTDADSNSSGEATLQIWPNLRSSPSDGATVVVSNAKGVFRLSSNETSWNINRLSLYGITFGATESL